MSAKHFDSKYEVSQEATLVRTLNETVNNLVYLLSSVNLKEQLYNIRNSLFKVLDIPIFIQQNTKISNIKDKDVINQYLKEILLFLVHNVKKNLNASARDEFNSYIKYLQNKKLEIKINARKVQNLLNSLSAQKQHMDDKYYEIINNLQALDIKNTKTLDINRFYKNNKESLKYLVQDYFNLILYDARKHLSLLLLTIQQQTYGNNTMDYFCTSEYKNFLKILLKKKDFATEFIQFINQDYKKTHNKILIYNKKAIIRMLDNDDSEFSFQFSSDESLLAQHENPMHIYKCIDRYFYTNSATITTEQRIKFIEYILELDAESNSVVVVKLEDAKIGNISAIQWYINTCSDNSAFSGFLTGVKNILTKCNERTLKKINIDEQAPYKWYFDHQENQENRIEVTNSLLRHSDSYVIEFCQYILTLDIPIIKAKGGKIRDSYPFFTWYIKSISKNIADNTHTDLIAAINNILIKCNQDIIRNLLEIKIDDQEFLEWYIKNKNINNNTKLKVLKSIIGKCNDTIIIQLIEYIIFSSQDDYTYFITELANIQIHNQRAIKWYLGNHNVTHNDKVIAINSIIPALNDHDILTIIKDILTTDSIDLKKELINIQVHNQNAIKWYLGNHNVTHNDKVTAINSIIPIFEDDNILTIIKDILTADNLNLIDALGREVTIHNKQAMKWYLSSVNHIEIIQHIEKIISLYNQTSDATLYDVIDYIITHCDQLLLKELDTKTTTNGLSILHWYIKYMIDLTYNDIARSLYSILMECSRNTIQSIEQLHINDQLIFHWYMQHIKEHGINLNNYENDINDLVYQDVGTSVIQILMKCNTDTIQSIEHLYYNNVPIFYWYINNYVDSDQYMIQALHNILIKCSINTVQLIEMADVNNTSVFLYYVKYIRTHGANFDNTYDYVEDDLMQVLNYIQLKCSENTIQQISRLHMNREPILQWYNNMRYNGFYEMDGLDQKSIHYNLQNIHGAKRMLNQSKVIVEYVHEYNKYLSILGIQDYKDNNHAVVFFKYGDSLSIIDPLDYISGCSNSFIKLKNQFLSSGIKTIDIVYSGLQQPDSGVCADISLILVKNLADKLQDIQSVQDVISVIQDVRVEMYGRTLEKNQETIIIKSFDAVISKVIDGLTRLNNYDVGIQDKQQ